MDNNRNLQTNLYKTNTKTKFMEENSMKKNNKNKANNKKRIVVIVFSCSTIPVDATCGSFIYLEMIIPDELSSKNCGCMCINFSNKSNLTSLVIL